MAFFLCNHYSYNVFVKISCSATFDVEDCVCVEAI